MACQKLIDKLKKTADEMKYSLEAYSMKKRQASLMARTLHGAGIVVPYNKKTQIGYRNLVETDGKNFKYGNIDCKSFKIDFLTLTLPYVFRKPEENLQKNKRSLKPN